MVPTLWHGMHHASCIVRHANPHLFPHLIRVEAALLLYAEPGALSSAISLDRSLERCSKEMRSDVHVCFLKCFLCVAMLTTLLPGQIYLCCTD